MVYYPEGMVQSINNMIVLVCVLSALLIIVMSVAIIAAFFPEAFLHFCGSVKRFFVGEKRVKTVYSDKTKNYSGTEFLPVPAKAPTDSFTFEFLGWNKFAKDKNGNFVVEPIFLKKVKTCIIKVYDEKDNVLETHEVEYGAGIKISHKLILKASTNEFEYEFVGWNKETKAFFENTEIRPVFKAKPIKYSYKFVLDDGSVIFEKCSISGTPIVCPTDPVKIDDKNIYEFVGWKGYKRGMVLDGDYEFVAIFERKEEVSDKNKLSKQKNAIEVALNDYKPKKKEEDYSLQDNQSFKSPKRVVVEKNEIQEKPGQEKPQKEENKSLLKGVIVEKNKSKKK